MESNIKIGGYTKKNDKNNKKSKILQFQEDIKEIGIKHPIVLVGRVFGNGRETGVQSQVELFQTLKNGAICQYLAVFNLVYMLDLKKSG